ncbi:MAG: hypothetical protein HC922_10475 [Leptolyngbyaceae cyanobacterium SM2_3_12]|nr:hypothetical protein [Leptolyngbyaceae cyanobacterium SM2_3_12]
MTDIRAIPLAEIDSTGSRMPPYISKGVPFVVRAGFRITSDDSTILAETPTALAQFSVRNRLTQDCIALGTAQTAIQGDAFANVQSPPVT